MVNALKLMVFLGSFAGAFFLLDWAVRKTGVKDKKTQSVLAIGLTVVMVIAFGVIFGFEGGYTIPDWSERARR